MAAWWQEDKSLEAISAVECVNRIHPEVLNMAEQFSDGFLVVDCALAEVGAIPLPGCEPCVASESSEMVLDLEYVSPERWDQALLIHPGLQEPRTRQAVSTVFAAAQGRGLRKLLMVEKQELLLHYAWLAQEESGNLNYLNVKYPSTLPLKLDVEAGFTPLLQSEEGGRSAYHSAYVSGRLFLGSRRAVQCTQGIQALGINAVVDLSTPGGNVAQVPEEQYLRLEIADSSEEAEFLVKEVIPRALAFIAKSLNDDCRCVIHCDKGASRSGSVAIAWEMVCARDKDYKRALKTVQSYRPFVKPNPGFATGLKEVGPEMFNSWLEAVYGPEV